VRKISVVSVGAKKLRMEDEIEISRMEESKGKE
jgi:hypothetical protein